MKVAVGYATPSTPDARWNEREIPAGYAKVEVDEVVPMFSDMLLDMHGPNDETTLGEVHQARHGAKDNTTSDSSLTYTSIT